MTQTHTVAIADIEIGERHRKFDPEAAKSIARSIAAEGLLHAILLSRREGGKPKLVAGRHRLEAHKLNGQTTIHATYLATDGMSPEEAAIAEELAEIEENLQRKNLDGAQVDRHIVRKGTLLARRGYLQKRGPLLAEQAALAVEAAALAAAKATAKATGKPLPLALIAAENTLDATKQKLKQRALRLDATEVAVKAFEDQAGTEFCPEGQKPVPDAPATKLPRLPHGVVEVLAQELGTTTGVVMHAISRVRTLGVETTKMLEGTALASKHEREALITLRKDFPKQAAFVETAVRNRPTAQISAITTLRDAKMAKAQEENAIKRETPLGAITSIQHFTLKALAAIGEAETLVSKMAPDVRRKFQEYAECKRRLGLITTLLGNLRSGVVQETAEHQRSKEDTSTPPPRAEPKKINLKEMKDRVLPYVAPKPRPATTPQATTEKPAPTAFRTKSKKSKKSKRKG